MTATRTEQERIAGLCRHIEAHADEPLPLAGLAARAGLSPGHLQRRFKALVGLSPRQYQEACRLRRLRTQLRAGGRVSDAVQDAGFGADSRVYERSDRLLGMTPARYARGGAGETIAWATRRTPDGWLLLAATDRGLCSVLLGDARPPLLAALAAEFPQARLTPMPARCRAQFAAWMQVLQGLLAGAPVAAGLPLDIRGTAFQQRVWRYLQTIPRGQTRSYAQVAAAIGQPGAARAVGSACGSNRLALLIPCHRVLRGDGGTGGYRWGEARKQRLLERERGTG